ncbi:ROK family protein [Cerasicoccus maritimus]|uniref:ROK family protein n=1 Tax=Cerasicoccus maritimus TaxID=490089 RepID=UPI002852D548|nr:ROK family protein [Cerasicoccus maritimus]
MKKTKSTESKSKNNRKQAQIANRLRILRLIYSQTPYSQRGLTLETQLQASTISNIVAELLQSEIITEGETLESGKVGPRETILQINPRITATVGINVHTTAQDICLINGNGDIISHECIEKRWNDESIQLIADQIRQTVKKSGLKLKEIGGIGFAIPGVVDNETGTVILSRSLKLENFPLRKIFGQKLKIPVNVDRNVICGSYFEQHSQPDLKWANSGYLFIKDVTPRKGASEYSVGMALTVNGKIYRGINHAAGELDAVLLPSEEQTAKSRTSSQDFFHAMGSHLASVVNLLDIGKLIISSDGETMTKEDFTILSTALSKSLIPISNRTFEASFSRLGFSGMTQGAALQVLHQKLENDLSNLILNH